GLIYVIPGRKNPKLVLDHNEFVINRKFKNRTTWRCTAYHKTKCRSALCTYGKIVKIYNYHNHSPYANHHDVAQLISQSVTITRKK
ncbi:unnamed protein product, partial [Tenebrio molitor]